MTKLDTAFEDLVDATLADIRAELIASSQTYTQPPARQVLANIVTEVGRVVRGELMLLSLAQTGGVA